MSMSKRDFIALADAIREANRAKAGPTFTDEHLEILARFCSGQNWNFKRGLWFDYIAGVCGPSGGRLKPDKP